MFVVIGIINVKVDELPWFQSVYMYHKLAFKFANKLGSDSHQGEGNLTRSTLERMSKFYKMLNLKTPFF